MDLDETGLKEALTTGRLTVAVYGLGHVGAPILAAWLMAGSKGIGVDVLEDKVRALKEGRSPVEEPCLSDVFSRALSEGRLDATTDGVVASRKSDVKIIAVPTLVEGNGRPDLSAVKEVSESIGAGLKRGDLVILESSVPPGTTRNLVKPILERESGLTAGKDFGLAYSPERIAEGRALRDIVESYPKIVGGYDERSSRIASSLYGIIAKRGVIVVSSDVAAEFEKLAEGVYRDVNIALANELAELARSLGLDFEEIRSAANSQPYSHIHRPGTGVGGLCIPIYPKFLKWVAEGANVRLELTETARRINELMPSRIAALVVEAARSVGIEEVRVTVLGLAFRGDVADSRLSPTYDLIDELTRRGANVKVVHDPLIGEDPRLESKGVSLTRDLREALEGSNVAVISTDHTVYRMRTSEFFSLHPSVKLIVDGRDVMDVDDIPEGRAYVGVGRPLIDFSRNISRA